MTMSHGNLGETVEIFTFISREVYGCHCFAILFTSGSIKGRGTTVISVLPTKDGKKSIALKAL